MIEQKQKYLHRPEEGQIGDCFRTCIACVLSLPRDEVPHVYQDAWNQSNSAVRAHALLNGWLRERGLFFAEFPIEANQETLTAYIKHYFKDQHILLGCNSKNGGHSVVRCGDYIWDPSLDESGCVGPMDDGYYWIGLLLKNTSEC